MAWTLTDSLEQFTARAGEHLRADPVRHTLPLTLLATLRDAGPTAFGGEDPVYGWHEAGDGTVDGAFLQKPPLPVLVATLPAGGTADFIDALIAGHGLPQAVNLAGPAEAAFLAAWADVAGGTASVGVRSRLFRLGDLTPPEPAPAGVARMATEADRDLLLAWLAAFHAEATRDSAARVARHGRQPPELWRLHALGGRAAARRPGRPHARGRRSSARGARLHLARAPAARLRRGGHHCVTQAALDDGAQQVVLFTDQANPTSNALYQRLGYRPVEERVVLDLQPGAAGRADVTATDGVSSGRL